MTGPAPGPAGVRLPNATIRVGYRPTSNFLINSMAERVGFEPTWGAMPPTDFESVPL